MEAITLGLTLGCSTSLQARHGRPIHGVGLWRGTLKGFRPPCVFDGAGRGLLIGPPSDAGLGPGGTVGPAPTGPIPSTLVAATRVVSTPPPRVGREAEVSTSAPPSADKVFRLAGTPAGAAARRTAGLAVAVQGVGSAGRGTAPGVVDQEGPAGARKADTRGPAG